MNELNCLGLHFCIFSASSEFNSSRSLGYPFIYQPIHNLNIMPAEVRNPPRRSGSGDVGPRAIANTTAPQQQVRRSKRPFSGDDGMHIEGSGDVDRRQVALLRKPSAPDAMKKSKQMRSTGGDLCPPMTIRVKEGGKKGKAPADGKPNGPASIQTGTTATLSSWSGSGSNPAGGRRTKTGITSRSYRQPVPLSASAGGSGEHRRTRSGSGEPQLAKTLA